MRLPLRFQILLPLASVAVVSLVTVGVINARLATRETEAAIGGQLEGVIDVLRSSNFPLTDSVLKQMNGLSGAEFVLMDQAGEVVSASQSTLANELLPKETMITDKTIGLGPQTSIGGRAYFHSMLPLARPLGNADKGTLHILFPLKRYNEAWRSAFVPPLVVGVATVIAVTIVTHWIASRVSYNLATLGASVQRLAGGDFKPLQIPDRDDELRDLTVAVNQTAAKLSEFEEHVRQTEQMRAVAMLGAGLAHEMRNAATGCRLAIDLHAENCLTSTADDSLVVAKSQLQLMESRLRGFLQLGRVEASVHPQRVDLKDLVTELVPLVRPAARHAGVNVDWKPPAKAFAISGQSEGLGMVVVNLLLNAIEAAQRNIAHESPPHVEVKISQESGDIIRLEVSDSGAGLTADVANSLFQPFVSTKPEGVGLGLAVAQQAVRAHGGELSWCRDSGRTCFRLELPAASDTSTTDRNCNHAQDLSRR